jgi:hypothetical protein
MTDLRLPLGVALGAIQERLNSSGLGIEEYYETELGYGRLGDGWARLTRSHTYETDADGTPLGPLFLASSK